MEFYGIKYEEYKSFNNCRPKSYQLDYNPYIQIVHTVKKDGDSRREEYPPGFSIQIPKELLPNKDNIYIVYGCW